MTRWLTLLGIVLCGHNAGAEPGFDPDWGANTLRGVDIDGYTLHFVERGAGEPVVLVHGALSDYRYWQPVVEAGAERFRFVSYSRRGFHPNARESGEADDAWAHVEDLEALLERLDSGPAHLVGHSAGGHIALLVAIRRPDLVRSLVLEEGGFISEGSAIAARALAEFPDIVERYTAMYRGGDTEAAVEYFMTTVIGDERFDALPADVARMARDNAGTLGVRANPPLSCDLAEAVAAPTLLVLGAETPALLTDFLAGLADCLEGEESVTIGGVSHDIHLEDSGAFNEVVLDFLGRHAAQ